jgi:hypothetical protein
MMPRVRTHERRGRRRAALLLGLRVSLAIAAATVLYGWGATAHGAAEPSFPTHVCGYFFRSGQDFIVYNGGGISCRRATTLIKGFVLGHPKQHGTITANSYWTIKGEPGFKCTEATGEGQCFKGGGIAGYRIKA